MIINCTAGLHSFEDKIEQTKSGAIIFISVLLCLIAAIVLTILQKNKKINSQFIDLTIKIPLMNFLGPVNIYILCFSIITSLALINLCIKSFGAIRIYLTLDSIIITSEAKIRHFFRICKEATNYLEFFENIGDNDREQLKVLIEKIQKFFQNEGSLVKNLSSKDAKQFETHLNNIHFHHNWLFFLMHVRNNLGINYMFAPNTYRRYFLPQPNLKKLKDITKDSDIIWLCEYLEKDVLPENPETLIEDFKKLYRIFVKQKQSKKRASFLLDIHCRLSKLFRHVIHRVHSRNFSIGKTFLKQSPTDRNFIECVVKKQTNPAHRKNLLSYI